MAIRFTATMNAVNRGLESMAKGKAVNNIEDWETALADTDVPGSKGILRDLGALRKQLERDEPDSERVLALLHRLGEATQKIAGRAEKSGDKLTELGTGLSESGEGQADEEEDTAAKAAPKRRGRKAN